MRFDFGDVGLDKVNAVKFFDGKPFVFITNYDNDEDDSHDPRSTTANALLKEGTRHTDAVSMESLKRIMNNPGWEGHKGILVMDTAFTAMMSAASDHYEVE